MARFLLATVSLAALALPARADVLPLVVAAPGTYTPGAAFTFEVRAPGVADLGLYNVELVFSAAGPINLLSVEATPDAALSPFGTLANFAAESTPGVNELRLTLSDFTLGAGVTTVAGTNDLLAVITLTAGPVGPIRVSVAEDSRFFDTADGEPIPSDAPTAFTVAQADTPAAGVPAPPGFVLMGIGAGVGLLSRRRARRAVRSARQGDDVPPL